MSTHTCYIANDIDRPRVELIRPAEWSPITTVYLNDGHLSVQGDDPMVMLRIAKAFEKAAEMLANEQLEVADLRERGA